MIGLGCMRLSTRSPRDPAQAIAVIHAALDAGVTLLDTADAYALDESDAGHNERLVAEALRTWRGDRSTVVVATKGGLTRPGGRWVPEGSAVHLRAACDASLCALDASAIDLYQLHTVDARTPIETSVRTMAALQGEGKVRSIGLCNVTVAQIEAARRIAEISAVQVSLSLLDDENLRNGVAEYCREHGIRLIAYRPLGGDRIQRIARDPVLAEIAARREATPQEVALAWLLDLAAGVIPIPGATSEASARSMRRVPRIRLSDEDRERLDVLCTSASGASAVLDPRDVTIAPGRRETLARHHAEGRLLLAIAWRSQIASGSVEESAVRACHERACGLLGLDIEVAHCPHPAGPPICWCRKPLPGLVLEFAFRHRLAAERCLMVGRSPADRTRAGSAWPTRITPRSSCRGRRWRPGCSIHRFAPMTTTAHDLSRLTIDRSAPTAVRRGFRRTLLFAGSALVLIIAIALVLLRGSVVPVQVVVAAAPESGVVAGGATAVTANGYVVARTRASVAAKLPGRLAELHVSEGSFVRRGEVIARLENADYEAQLAEAQANVASARAGRIEAEAEHLQLEREARRQRDIRAQNAQLVAQQALEAAESRAAQADARARAATARVDAAEAGLRYAEASLANTIIRAPFTGTVLRKEAEVGEVVAPSVGGSLTRGAVVTMADLTTLEVEVDVNEAYIARVVHDQARASSSMRIRTHRFAGRCGRSCRRRTASARPFR